MRDGPPAAAHRPDTVEAYQAAVERVIAHFKTHLAEPFDLDHIAQEAAISKFHVVRVFDEITGTTPHHFLACLRMQRAKELLLRSDTPITDVCLEVGYTSLGSFSTTFHSLVGLSPQEFRALPKSLSARQFARAIWRFIATRRKISGPPLVGTVEGPPGSRGFIFVGTFTGGVPQGLPFSGTVLLRPGSFRIEHPRLPGFHLLAALMPLSASLRDVAASLPVRLVASLRLENHQPGGTNKPRLSLRPVRSTDPPIVLALPALPELRGLVRLQSDQPAEEPQKPAR